MSRACKSLRVRWNGLPGALNPGRKDFHMIKKEFQKLCKRFDDVMDYVGLEHLETMNDSSEIYRERRYYGIEKGITLQWILDEAEFWLSCYYEPGNVRTDDKHEGPEGYREWRAESGRLKRLADAIRKYGNLQVCVEESPVA